MAPGNRIFESICGVDLTVNEARELFRRGAAVASKIKSLTGISSAISFAKAETSRIALQSGVDQLSGDELSRLRGTVLAANILQTTPQLCGLTTDVWFLGNDFGVPGDDLVQARDFLADWTQQIKKNHTPANVVVPPDIQPVLPGGAGQLTLPDESHTGLMVAAGGAALGLIGLALWAHNRA